MLRALAPALALFLLLPIGRSEAAECQPDDPAYYGSSMSAWIDAVAAELELRAAEFEIGRILLDVEPGAGIDPQRGTSNFSRRLSAKLKKRGTLQVGSGGATARFALSLDDGNFWAIGRLEGGGIPGGAAVAVPCPGDRELWSLMGSNKPGQGRWSMTRLTSVRADVLDVLLTDLSGDGQDEIILLATDGLRAYRDDPSEGTLPFAGPVPFPAGHTWPAIVAGWLAEGAPGRVAIATSAGHSLWWGGSKLSRRKVASDRIVPLRRPERGDDLGEGLALEGHGPALDAQHLGKELSSPLRDLAAVPGRPGTWIYVEESGQLGLLGWDEARSSLPSGPVGDRILVDDLDGDGKPELVTTSAAGPGEPDSLTVHRLSSGSSGGVLFSESLEGSILGIAAGDHDFDGLPDLLVVEERKAGAAQLWVVERSR